MDMGRLNSGVRAQHIFTRAVIAFVVLPGIVAYLVPGTWVWLTGQALRWPYGLTIIALGTFGLLWSVRDFYVSGKGTLAPWAPPQTLVVVGLYRYSRNPMYACVLVVLLGWAVSFGSVGLSAYALAVGVAFHLRVVLGEEPWLARTHGAAWQQYARRVRRWF
jgi:protein-S-isoprenylcysteine O-methyltransferase Ste14